MHTPIATLVAFVSGFLSLGYVVLCSRSLTDVIGAPALTSGAPVGVAFVAFTAGAVIFGWRASHHSSPWRLYGVLETTVVVAIFPAFFSDTLTDLMMRSVDARATGVTAALLVEVAVSLVLLAPVAFLIGGTLPTLVQASVHAPRLARGATTLYAFHLLGGAGGLLLVTFILLPTFGAQGSFISLILLSLVLASGTLQLAKYAPDVQPSPVTQAAVRGLRLPAFAVGFAVVGLALLVLLWIGPVSPALERSTRAVGGARGALIGVLTFGLSAWIVGTSLRRTLARADARCIGTRAGELFGLHHAGALLGITLAAHVAVPALGLSGAFLVWSLVVLLLGTALIVRARRPGDATP